MEANNEQKNPNSETNFCDKFTSYCPAGISFLTGLLHRILNLYYYLTIPFANSNYQSLHGFFQISGTLAFSILYLILLQRKEQTRRRMLKRLHTEQNEQGLKTLLQILKNRYFKLYRQIEILNDRWQIMISVLEAPFVVLAITLQPIIWTLFQIINLVSIVFFIIAFAIGISLRIYMISRAILEEFYSLFNEYYFQIIACLISIVSETIGMQIILYLNNQSVAGWDILNSILFVSGIIAPFSHLIYQNDKKNNTFDEEF